MKFRVYPNGYVEWYQQNIWWEYDFYEDDYDAIQAAGLVDDDGDGPSYTNYGIRITW